MKQYIRHILYYTICIVFLVLALWAIWWFRALKEGFQVTAPPFLVLVAKTSTGAIYYADVDVPFTPKWHASRLTATGSIGVAYGQLYTITGTSSIPQVSSYDAAVSAATSGPALKHIYVDDDGTIGGIDATGNVYYGSSKNTNTMMKSVAFSGTNAYGVGTDGSLYFTSNPGSGTWTKTNTGTTWKQVVFSGALVCAINNAGNISYAINDITTASTVWKTNSGPIVCPTFNYISLQGRRIIGVGTDTNIYYTDDVTSSFIWRTVPIKIYDKDGGELGETHTISGSVRTSRQFIAPVFTAVEIMYPDPSARRKRFVDVIRSSGSADSTVTKSCNKSETLIGNYCYQPCPDGRSATGTQCPYLRKHIPAKAICPAGTDIINNTCFNPCSSNYTTQGSTTISNYTEDPANNQQCLGATIPKISSSASTPARAASFKPCDANNGAVRARYIRIRPSQSYSNNKLCLQNVTVMGYKVDSDGVMDSTLVNLSSTGSAFSTDGVCASGPLADPTASNCSFKSGTTYDKDSDGGKTNRMINTYWEVDLHSMHYVKSVAITACLNSSISSGSSGSSTDETSNQMNGVRLEILRDYNGEDTKPITERTLGPNPNPTATGPFTQTVTFKFGEGNILISGAPTDTCYDVCPMFGGVQSVPLGNGSCTVSTKHISKKSVSMPQIVRPQTLLPPASLIDANGSTIPTEWTADPTDITQFLTCSMFPGSSLHSLVSRTINGHRYTYLNPSTGLPNPNVSGYICVKAGSINASMCPVFTSHDNGHRPDLIAYKYDPATFTCYIPQNVHRHWDCNTACAWNFDNMSCDIPWGIDRFTYCCTGKNIVAGRGGEQRCWRNTSAFNEHAAGQYGKTSKDNYALPNIPGSLLRLPLRMPGRQGCFDSAGNKTDLFLYNNSCAKCMGARDTFYARGISSPDTSRGSDYGIYNNQAFSTSPIPTLFADDYVAPPPTSAPTVNANTTVRIDEVYGPPGLSPNPPPLTEEQRAATTILSRITNGLESAATFFSSLANFRPSGNPTKKFIHTEGAYLRTLDSSHVGSIYSSGICVGACDKDHSKEMPLQMHVINGKYVLWGVACESVSNFTVRQSSIPKEFVPESESKCPANTAYNSSDGRCYTECNTLQIDNGTTCTYKTVPRPYVSPTYSCTSSGLTLAGSVCLYGCKAGTVANGAYCEPDPIVLPKLPTMYGEQVIMCNKTPGGRKSGKDINKWLCESADNAYLLVSPPCNDTGPDCIFPDPQVTNPNVPYSYIGRDDIICHADSSGSTVYVCQSPSDYLNAADTATKEQMNSQMTCDNLSAAYLDLSNNLSVMATSGSMAQTTATRIANMQATLQGVYNILCENSTPLSSCPTLRNQIATLKSSINSGSSTLANIINPYEMGISSRTMLVGQMNSMGCTIPK